MITSDEIFAVGKSHKPHGLKGELACSFFNDFAEEMEVPYLIIEVDHIFVPFFIDSFRYKGEDTVLITFQGVANEQEARLLADTTLYLPKRFEHKSGEVTSLDDMVGFRVVELHSGVLGVVTAIDQRTENVLFEIENGEYLLPAHDDFVERVDYEERTIYLNLPQGLLDLETAEDF